MFVLFLKGKQNKKETSKYNFLFRKCGIWKTKLGSGSDYLLGRYDKDHSTPLSP